MHSEEVPLFQDKSESQAGGAVFGASCDEILDLSLDSGNNLAGYGGFSSSPFASLKL